MCRTNGFASLVLLGLLLVPASGCLIAADAINRDALSALGLDPTTVAPSPGAVVVAFVNNTAATVDFHAYEAVDPADLSHGARNFTVTVSPGEIRNEVLECPVELLSLGTVDEAFAVDATAAFVFVGEAPTAVPYAGSPLTSGKDFRCGDVIVVEIDESAAGAAGFALRLRVIPGR